MTSRSRALAVTTFAAAAVWLSHGASSAYTEKVKKACDPDYYSFCSQYPPESTELRRCFESNRKSLSRPCVNALIDAGEVPAKYLKK